MNSASLNSRAAVGLASVAAVAAVVFAFAGPNALLAELTLFTSAVLVLFWLLAAFGVGAPVVAAITNQPADVLGTITAIAAGLGVMSLAVLLLGLAGWLSQITAIAIIAVGAAAALRPIWAGRERIESFLRQRAARHWLWLIAILPASVAAIGAVFPPGILWGDEPNGYDVVEYHLQVPRQWFDLGRIVPLHENVFSFFPQAVEMHYLLAMHLLGGPWAGMYLAQFMHMAMCALAVAAVAAAAGMGAGLIVAVTPWLSLLAPVAYVEGGVLLYGSLAILWAQRAADARAMCMAGLLAGFACGAKLTNIPMLVVAIPIAAAAASPAGVLKKSAAFWAAAALALAPWLLRTGAWAGNPVFPEVMNLLGRGHFSPVQVERWRRAYLPTTTMLDGFLNQIVADWRFGYALLPAAIIGAGLTFRQPKTRFLLALLIVITIIWLGFTHLQSRFFVLAIPICALLISEIQNRWTCAAVLAVLLIAGLPRLATRLLDYRDKGLAAVLGVEDLSGLATPDVHHLPPLARLDFVGGAYPFWYQLPSQRIGYRTVFDVDTSDPDRSIVQDWLNGSDGPIPNRYIVIDPDELARLSRTYYGIPPLSPAELQSLRRRADVVINPQN